MTDTTAAARPSISVLGLLRKYAILLGTNLYGLVLCTAGFCLPVVLGRHRLAASGNVA